jgi:co-chaperonin GroES (HSP10)
MTSPRKPSAGFWITVAVGPGRLLDDGRRAALTVKVGDAVLF